MHTLIRAAALSLALQQGATMSGELAAQGKGSSTGPTNSACGLVTEKEVEAATGLDYRPGDALEPAAERIEGAVTCMWGGPGRVSSEDLPEIGVSFIAPGARGSFTERSRKLQPLPGCTREAVRGVGDGAFAEICDRHPFSVSVYARAGRNDVLVRLYLTFNKMSKASVKPAAIALAKAAAARAKGK
jgi:hypothetical protein